jgi:(R,R)-butanediol dehydrogenase / meso-butanediol dehydrogenase / diacetyl reductase
MKALIWIKENLIEIRDIRVPHIRDNEVLIKVKYAGICGSDITVMKGKHISAKPPVILGHEFSGVVEKSNSKNFKIGDKVVVEPLIYCGKCEACNSGSTHVCRHLKLYGIHKNGGFAEFVKIPDGSIYKLPDEVTLLEGALVEPLSVAIHSIDMSGMKVGDNVLIAGAGPIGILCGILAQNFGANNVIITDISNFRLDIARKFGMISFNSKEANDFRALINNITDNCGVDICFECSGVPEVISQSLGFLAIKGTLVQVGIGKNNVEVDMKTIAYEEQRIVGVRVYAKGDFNRAINFVASKKENLQEIVTNIIKFEDILEAFKLSENTGESLKILIEL